MSLLDSMKYGRRSMSSFTREEIEQIRNTLPADHTALKAESARVLARIHKEREMEANAAAAKQ